MQARSVDLVGKMRAIASVGTDTGAIAPTTGTGAIKVSCDHDHVIIYTQNASAFASIEARYTHSEYDRYVDRTRVRKLFHANKRLGKITLPIGYLNNLIYWVVSTTPYKIELDDSAKTRDSGLPIIEKWHEILDTNFHMIGGKTQYDNLKLLTSKSRSLGQLYTGYGKTELALAIVESYLEQYDGKVVILVPTSKIRDEFLERAKKWDVAEPLEYAKFQSRVQLINPMGFARSKAFLDLSDEIRDYFNQTGLILIDEVHHLSAASYRAVIEKIPNYRFIYGMSGTVDASEGETPDDRFRPNDLTYNYNLVLGYFGAPRMVVRNPKYLLVTYLRFMAETEDVPEEIKSDYRLSIRRFFQSERLVPMLSSLLERCPDRRVFIPTNEIDIGKSLVDRFNEYMGEGTAISVSASEIYPPLPEGYTDLKDYLRRSKFRIICGTTALYEGFDSDRINTVFLAVGKAQRMTIQPIGRGVRSDDLPLVIFPYDTSRKLPIINSQTKNRYRKLQSEYSNCQYIDFEDLTSASTISRST